MNKNNFAKRLIPILLCISLVLSIIGRLAAYATESYEIIGKGNPVYYSLSDSLSNYGSGYEHSYIYINYKTENSETDRIVYTPYTLFIRLDSNVQYTISGDTITIPNQYIKSSYYYSFEYYIYNSDGHIYSNAGPTFLLSGYTINSDIVFDSSLNSISFDNKTLSSEIEYAEYDIGELTGKYSNIKVMFTPDLSGQVDRSFDDHGKTGYFENFDFEIWNNGNEAIQYKMYIVEKNQTNTRPVITNQNESYKQYDTLRYDDDEVFIYYTKDWVYSTETEVEKHASDNNGSWLNPNIFHKTSSEPKLRYKGTDWHYLEAGGYKHQPIYYSQVNLKEDTVYTVYVLAQICPYTSASTIWSDEGNTDNKSMTAAEYDIVYQSDFTMLQYSDVKYDPEDSRNGVLPYDGYQGLLDQTVYDVSYDAEQDSNGNINYSGFNFDKSQIPDTYGNTPSNLDGGAEIISNTSGVFRFFSVIFGVFPPEVNKILSISLWVGFALFLIRRLT